MPASGNGWKFETPLHDYQQTIQNSGLQDGFFSGLSNFMDDIGYPNSGSTSSDGSLMNGSDNTSAFQTWLNKLSEDDWRHQLELMELEHGFSAREAQKLRDWQQSLSDTAIQRAVKDAKLAGLNPYLTIGHMSAASTPSGAAAQGGSRAVVQSAGNSARIISSLISAVGDLLSTVADNLTPSLSLKSLIR